MSEELLNCPFCKNSMELQILKAEKLCDNWDDCARKCIVLDIRTPYSNENVIIQDWNKKIRKLNKILSI